MGKARKSQDGFDAINQKDAAKLKEMLKGDLSPNTRNDGGDTLLTAAIKKNDSELVKTLLDAKADVNLPSEAKDTFLANPKGVVSDFINEKQKITGLTPLMVALNQKDNDNHPIPPNKKILDLLIQNKADVNTKEATFGLTPLHFAANHCSLEAIEKLAEAGAKLNAPAFSQGVPDAPMLNKFDITPIALAVDTENRDVSSQCIAFLEEKGADIIRYRHVPEQFGGIISLLGDQDVDKAQEILFKEVDQDLKNMDHEKVQETLDLFLASNPKDEATFEQFAHALIGKDSEFLTLANEMKYYGHLNSWVGDVAGDFSGEDGKKTNKHLSDGSEGWWPQYQSFSKITSLLYILKGVENGSVDCQERFRAPKDEVVNKLREEIAHQVSTYYSIKHQFYHVNMPDPSAAIKEGDLNGTAPGWDTLDQIDVKKQLSVKLISDWCDKIGKLKDQESFCLYLGSKDHATYVEFRKTDEKHLTRIIYNLGGASQNHPMDLDGKSYPYIVKELPQEAFKKHTVKARNNLSNIIKAEANSCYIEGGAEDKTKGLVIHPTFKAAYDVAYALGGKDPTNEDMKNFVAMKKQIAGNCSVKNNLCAMKNRLGPDLADFVKNFEILRLENKLNIGEELKREKEIEKDLQRFDFIRRFGNVEGGEKFMEKNLFAFFEKRSETLPNGLDKKPGDRIAYAMEGFQDPQALKQYFSRYPQLFEIVNKVADKFHSQPLKEQLMKVKTLEFSKKDQDKTREPKDDFHLMQEMPNRRRNYTGNVKKEKNSTLAIPGSRKSKTLENSIM